MCFARINTFTRLLSFIVISLMHQVTFGYIFEFWEGPVYFDRVGLCFRENLLDERLAGVEGGTMSDEGLGDNHLHPRLDDGHAWLLEAEVNVEGRGQWLVTAAEIVSSILGYWKISKFTSGVPWPGGFRPAWPSSRPHNDWRWCLPYCASWLHTGKIYFVKNDAWQNHWKISPCRIMP